MKKSYKAYSDSHYLKKEDFPEPALGTISDVREEKVTVPGGEPKDKLVIYFNELDKGLVSNLSHGDTLLEIAGSDDPEKWIGARVEIYNEPNVEYKRKKVGGIRLREPLVTLI